MRFNQVIQYGFEGFVLALLACVPPGFSVAADVPDPEARLLTHTRQLIFEGRRSGEGYFSVDGSRMIFQSEREPGNPFYQMYLLDLETGDTRRVSSGVGKTTCGWIHPDGERALFASTHADPRAQAKQREELDKRAAGTASRYSWSFDEHYDIYEALPDGGGLRNLTNAPGYDAEGSWSPDGRSIVFASNRHAYAGEPSSEEREIFAHDKSYFMELYVMDADGNDVRRLTDSPGYDGGPFFSPDGRRIVWRRFAPNGATAEIWSMNRDGGDPRQITDLGAMSWAPFYHPSGEYIVFATNLHGMANFELYLVDVAGRADPVRVTFTEGFDGLPVFAPDGQRLSWSSKRGADGKAQIFIADWNHRAARELLGLADQASEVPAIAPGATTAAIDPADLRRHVEYLAAETLGGRLTGSEGDRLAAEYVAGVFRSLGLEPAGDRGGYFQEYEFTAGVSLAAGNRFAQAGAAVGHEFRVDQDWRPLAFSASGDVDPSGVVFVGYGMVAPAANGLPEYDSYAELDVADKWVMLFRYLPEDITPEHRQHLANWFELRYKAMLARERGARGVIVVSGPNAGVREQLVPLRFDTALAGTSLAVLSVTDAAADQLLAGSGRTVTGLQSALDTGEPVAGFAIPATQLEAAIRIRQERRTSRNVLARLPAGETPTDSAVVIGAHLDHIGDGIGFDSLARAEEEGRVHRGADDNASGVAGLLEIAQWLAALKEQGKLSLQRDIVFAAWSGEEMGLLGSGHFVKTLAEAAGSPGNLHSRVAAYLNMDMIGRLDGRAYLQGAGSSPVWAREIERRNAPVGLPVVTRNDAYLPTDATSFYLKGVPVLSAFTGTHAEYNTPRDSPETLNYEGAARIARLMGLILRSAAAAEQPPAYLAMDKPKAGASRRNLRAYLGTIPEYGETDVKGVKLNGVAKGGPADLAGLRAGDVIVELAGRAIENIYDYTYALNGVKVGQPVAITVRRGGERVSVDVTPGARE